MSPPTIELHFTPLFYICKHSSLLFMYALIRSELCQDAKTFNHIIWHDYQKPTSTQSLKLNFHASLYHLLSFMQSTLVNWVKNKHNEIKREWIKDG